MCVINCEEEKLKLDVPLAEVNKLHTITPHHRTFTTEQIHALEIIRFNLSWSTIYGPAASRNVSINTTMVSEPKLCVVCYHFNAQTHWGVAF